MSISLQARPIAVSLWLCAALSACGGGSTASPPPTVHPVPVAGAPVSGPADAWVTIVEYADFECSFCASEAPALEALLAAYPADLRLVFKEFPLPPSFHPDARPAALAAVCADAQGRFWPMHHLLFGHASGLGSAALEAYAAAAGLDLPTWRTCLTSAGAGAAVDADLAEGLGFGVPGTPTSFVNGVRYEGAGRVTAAVVEAARAAAQASGVARARYYDQVVLGR